MNITLVVEYAGRVRWQQPGPWARLLCQSLLERGHELRVVADCVTDTRHFAGARIEQRRPTRKRLQRSPLRFQRWALERVTPPSISLSSMVPGTLWCPLDAPWTHELGDLATMRSPATLAMEVLHRSWIPALGLAQRKAKAIALRDGSTIARLGALRAPTGVVPLGYCSTIDPSSIDADRLRRQVRQAFAINRHTFVACASASHVGRTGLREMLGGWRDSARDHGGLLLLMARKSALLDRIVGSLNMRDSVHIVGQTERPEAVLAAADLAIAWDTSPSSTGRFIADALVMQRPVLAHAACVGADLLNHGPHAALLSSHCATAWQQSLTGAPRLSPAVEPPTMLRASDLAARCEAALQRHL